MWRKTQFEARTTEQHAHHLRGGRRKKHADRQGRPETLLSFLSLCGLRADVQEAAEPSCDAVQDVAHLRREGECPSRGRRIELTTPGFQTFRCSVGGDYRACSPVLTSPDARSPAIFSTGDAGSADLPSFSERTLGVPSPSSPATADEERSVIRAADAPMPSPAGASPPVAKRRWRAGCPQSETDLCCAPMMHTRRGEHAEARLGPETWRPPPQSPSLRPARPCGAAGAARGESAFQRRLPGGPPPATLHALAAALCPAGRLRTAGPRP